MTIDQIASSYRDPSGFVFLDKGRLLRKINLPYKHNFEILMESGLYDQLFREQLLIPHSDVTKHRKIPGAYKVIQPTKIPFISYPYEWCFSQLKDAALLTLTIEKIALKFGMTLKDASSFNIQFYRGSPILIDTLSFEAYEEGKPWVAYKQFCEQFLAPLALANYDERLLQLLVPNLGNIPLDLTVKLLPLQKKISPGLLMHLVLHSQSQKKFSGQSVNSAKKNFVNKNSLLGLIDSLESTIKSLQPASRKTVWSEYTNNYNASYSQASLIHKKKIVKEFLSQIKPRYVWDLGANNGDFSRIASDMGADIISIDYDYGAVEDNYQQLKKNHVKNILPLCISLTNPTPPLGWNNLERDSLFSRPLPDTTMALALIHHLAITYNLPLNQIARLFSKLCVHLIIEFVPKKDPQTQVLLSSREDIFTDYSKESFEKEFSRFFNINKSMTIKESSRILYLMQKK